MAKARRQSRLLYCTSILLHIILLHINGATCRTAAERKKFASDLVQAAPEVTVAKDSSFDAVFLIGMMKKITFSTAQKLRVAASNSS